MRRLVSGVFRVPERTFRAQSATFALLTINATPTHNKLATLLLAYISNVERSSRRGTRILGALTQERCTACRRDSPLVTETEIRELQPQIPDWTIVEREGIQRLERVFTCKDFAEALKFTNRIGALAESEGHHPAILTEWGRVTVSLWTHKIRGLHRNDFIMAAKIDSIAAG